MRDPLDQRLRSIRYALMIIAGLFVVSTMVFWAIGGRHTLFDAVWITLHILTTVGDTGLSFSKPEKIWSVVLMVVGVMAMFYLGISVFQFVLDGDLRKALGRRQLQARIDKMQDHIIVCGFGRMGRALCDALAEKGTPFVVIDRSPEVLEKARERGYMYVVGDSMHEQTLKEVRINAARGLASCLPDDADNVFVTLTARELAPKLPIVSKANYEEGGVRLRRAGANHVLSPSHLAASRAMTKLMLPAVDELIEIVTHGPDLQISKVSLDRLPGAVDKPLRELGLPARTNLLVVAVVHGDGSRSFNPSPETRLAVHDEMIVIGPHGGVDKMVELFGERAA